MAGFDRQLHEFGDKPVVTFEPNRGIDSTGLCYRLEGYDEMPIGEVANAFAADPKAAEITALIVGDWNVREIDGDAAVAALVDVADRIPRLTHVMIGDVLHEDAHRSWMDLGPIVGILSAFKDLLELRLRGSANLSELAHARLQTLILEFDALRPTHVNALLSAELPHLRQLELWIGTKNDGAASAHELRPLLQQNPFESLARLGLRNAEASDDIAHMLHVAKPFELEGTKVLPLGIAGFTKAELKAELARFGASPARRGPRIGYSHGLTNTTDLVVIGDDCPHWDRTNYETLASAQGVAIMTEVEFAALLREEHGQSVLGQIHTLDLSLGTLTDVGAKALLANPALDDLDVLDIHHHYVSDAVCEQLARRVHRLDASDRQSPTMTPTPAL